MKLWCKIAVNLEQIDFTKQCMNNNRYPVSYCKALRRNGIRPTCRNLRRYAKCQLDAMVDRMESLRSTFNQRRGVLDELPLICYIKFTKFSTDTARRTRSFCADRLTKSLEHEMTVTELPENPELYIKNLSTVQLNRLQVEALSLGLDYCIAPKKTDIIESQAQFELFFDQFYPWAQDPMMTKPG